MAPDVQTRNIRGGGTHLQTNEGSGILDILDARHVRFLDRKAQMVLAGMYLGMTVREMAKRFGCSESTIIRSRRKTGEVVFDLTEIEGTPERLRLWSERHWKCCTAGAHEMIENSRLMTCW